MSENQKITEEKFREILKRELNIIKDDILGSAQGEISRSESKLLRVIRNENKKVMAAIANIAVNSPTPSMFKELEEKFDRYTAKN